MKRGIFWIALLALMILHHDWWFWTDGRLVFGIVPVGLAYHALISLAAGGLWAWAAFRAMPEAFADTTNEDPAPVPSETTQ